MRRIRLGLLPLLLLTGCAARPAAPGLEPPPMPGAGDPARAAVLGAAHAFADPARLAGRPAEAARAAAELEWLAAALPRDPGWIPANPALFPQLAAARLALRESLGLSAAAPPGEMVRALLAAAGRIEAGDRAAAAAALRPVAAGPAEAVLARLERLPPQPRAGFATRLAQEEMLRMGRDDPD